MFKYIVSMQSVTLHTDLGDIKIELQCELVPRACEVKMIAICEHAPYMIHVLHGDETSRTT